MIAATARRLFKQAKNKTKQRVRFAHKAEILGQGGSAMAVEITYDSEADGNYVSEEDRAKLRLPILRKSHRRVGVANGGASKGKHVTRLPFEQLSDETAEADTFEEFKTSLMSVGKTSDDGNVSVFTERDVKMYTEEDVHIMYKGKPIIVGRRDERGRYRIPLVQQTENWQPKKPTKASRKYL